MGSVQDLLIMMIEHSLHTDYDHYHYDVANQDGDDDNDDDVQVSLPTGSVFSYRCLPGHDISGSSLIW